MKSIESGIPYNNGKPLDEVQERQRRRKVHAIKEGVKKALWFCDSFGLDLLSVSFKSKAGRSVTLDYQVTPVPHEPQSQSSSADNQELAILFLLDKFGISDEVYHELSMANPFLPRSYLIKRVRERISNSIVIKRLPMPYLGCYRPLTGCIREALVAQVPLAYSLLQNVMHNLM